MKEKVIWIILVIVLLISLWFILRTKEVPLLKEETKSYLSDPSKEKNPAQTFPIYYGDKG